MGEKIKSQNEKFMTNYLSMLCKGNRIEQLIIMYLAISLDEGECNQLNPI